VATVLDAGGPTSVRDIQWPDNSPHPDDLKARAALEVILIVLFDIFDGGVDFDAFATYLVSFADAGVRDDLKARAVAVRKDAKKMRTRVLAHVNVNRASDMGWLVAVTTPTTSTATEGMDWYGMAPTYATMQPIINLTLALICFKDNVGGFSDDVQPSVKLVAAALPPPPPPPPHGDFAYLDNSTTKSFFIGPAAAEYAFCKMATSQLGFAVAVLETPTTSDFLDLSALFRARAFLGWAGELDDPLKTVLDGIAHGSFARPGGTMVSDDTRSVVCAQIITLLGKFDSKLQSLTRGTDSVDATAQVFWTNHHNGASGSGTYAEDFREFGDSMPLSFFP